ncbi:MAG: DUF6088 family protein [Mariprofundaceae bacterium]|nr:DUF6088 family protein [Mariprofundaceae bacterium]
MISRIYGRGRGWAFSANDFSAEFGRSTIDWVFYELVAKGSIRRVIRGIYDYPKYSELLQQELSPDFDQVAQALARKFNWRIQPTGDAALNLLGLSTQVPGRPVYLSDGPSRSYKIDNFTLEFKKSALKDVGFKHRESGLVVQALKALGKERINDSVIATIRKHLDDKARKRVLKDTVTATGWIYDAIKRICGERMAVPGLESRMAVPGLESCIGRCDEH